MTKNKQKITKKAKAPKPTNSRLTTRQVKMICDVEDDRIKPLKVNNACYMLCGDPGTGKTWLIVNMINTINKWFWGLYSKVFIYSPSIHTIGEQLLYDDIDLSERVFEEFDLKHLHNLLDTIKLEFQMSIHDFNAHYAKTGKRDYNLLSNALIIFDDFMTALEKHDQKLVNMLANRRHAFTSYIFVSQIFNVIDMKLRKLING
jgi:hypothetical protein